MLSDLKVLTSEGKNWSPDNIIIEELEDEIEYKDGF